MGKFGGIHEIKETKGAKSAGFSAICPLLFVRHWDIIWNNNVLMKATIQ
jgi:hypothetical protein